MPKHAISLSTALALCATPALADLSAEEVWADWQTMYAAMGMGLAADATYADGILTLENLSASIAVGAAESLSDYGTVTLVEQDDGTITIEIPETVEMMTTTSVDGVTTEQTVLFTTEGWDAVISEDGPSRVYNIVADLAAYEFTGGDQSPDMTGTIALTNLGTTYSSTPTDGDLSAIAQVFAADAMVMELTSDGNGAAFAMEYALDAIAGEGVGEVPLMPASDGPAFLGSLIFGGEMTHAGAALAVSGENGDGPFEITGTSGSGLLAFDITDDGLGYTFGSADLALQAQVPVFPLPVSVSMSEAVTGFMIPKGVSNDPKPFGLSISYRDLVIDDMLWGMFDPTGQLPRDPANVVIDLEGTALMTVDIFGDPEAMAAGAPPGELKTLDLSELLVSFAGAELTGTGAVEFPTPGPIPQPVGTVTLALDGGMGLLDKLVALGFVPAEQAAFIKGMSGVVARPVGEDQLESEIQFLPGGGITANGLPLQ